MTLATADIELNPITSDTRPLSDWVTSFQLLLVAIDPFTQESSWILETANRILKAFTQANCRVAWLITGTELEAKQFLGPLLKERLTFIDPDRETVKGLGLERLPALLHINHGPEIVGLAEGWNPERWRKIVKALSVGLSWRAPTIPIAGDPTPFEGSPI